MQAQGRGGIGTTNKIADEPTGSLKTIHNGTVCDDGGLTEKRALRDIDYLSVDSVGHELHVLKGIYWSKPKVDVMTVEGNDRADEIRAFMTSLGYMEHK